MVKVSQSCNGSLRCHREATSELEQRRTEAKTARLFILWARDHPATEGALVLNELRYR
jgi:hypothetical protein